MDDRATADTIVAIATAPGRGAVGIVRLSGPRAIDMVRAICRAELPASRVAALRSFHDERGQQLDRGLTLIFPAPNSYTGEDVVELQAHGGPVVLDLILRAACGQGARLAHPGEFSERAFLNDRLDLVQAEAVADLIDASSRAAVLSANRSLEGEFSRRVNSLAESLLDLRVFVEGALDFSDEDIDWLSDASLSTKLREAREQLAELLNAAAQGRRLREGMIIAIAGRPNVGKSTLLNRLAGTEAAIVSELPGTTRDLLREHLLIDDLAVTVVDTAGLRETGDVIEREGIRRTWLALEQAELALYLTDDREGLTADDRGALSKLPEHARPLIVFNKCDLSGRSPTAGEQDGRAFVRLSAATGDGLDLLRGSILEAAGLGAQTEGLFSARRRHLDALGRTRAHLETAAERLAARSAAELAAEELRRAHQALGEITGQTSSEDLLGAVFARFCIGK